MCLGAIPPNSNLAFLGALGALSGSHSARSALLGLAPPPPAPVSYQWAYVQQRFENFLANITLTKDQIEDGETKIKGVVKCLNTHYYGHNSETANHLLGGSWGKQTRVRPPRDIDIIFVLPVEVYNRYQLRTGNIQSALLQEVKGVIEATYPNTNMRGDGQVVQVRFNSYMVEVVPAILLQNGQYWICDTNDGGRYKTIDPVLETKAFDEADKKVNRNVRDLTRMLKQWQEYCNVDIPSFVFERLSMEFLARWNNAGQNAFWFDWMVRDFFAYMLGRENGTFTKFGTGQIVYIGNAWKSKAVSAYKAAEVACVYDQQNHDALAAQEWQKIFGTMIGRVT